MNLYRKMFDKFTKNERGGALIDFAIVMPVLILIAVGGAEVGRAMAAKEASIALSKAAANQAFRECTNFPQGKMVQCLNEVKNQLEAFSATIYPNTTVIVKIFSHDAATNVKQSASSASGGKTSKFSYNTGTGTLTAPAGVPNNLVQTREIIVVGEAFVPFQHLGTYTANMFGVENGLYYEATIA